MKLLRDILRYLMNRNAKCVYVGMEIMIIWGKKFV